MEEKLTIVIGAGVVGLAIARALSKQGKNVAILEAENQIGSGTSSRNSEIIHAGIYYPKDSLKAQFCVRGKELLYNYCNERNIPHRRIGKLIVASSEDELPNLHGIIEKAKNNNVNDLEIISGAELHRLEPEISGVGAIWSPSSGIIDSHIYLERLLEDAQAHGAMLALGNKVCKIEPRNNGFSVKIKNKNEPEYEIFASELFNCAGLNAWNIADLIKSSRKQVTPPNFFAKGSYFKISGATPFNHLIYPIPEKGGLGVHLTLDLEGNARFGPNVEWIEDINYYVDPTLEKSFREAIKRYYPDIENKLISPDFCGIRPKVSGPNDPDMDFLIHDEKYHGIPNLVNLFGIESPGLTSSLAIAEYIATK